MKIIDLLNKIANGEEVPKKIKYNGKIYEKFDYNNKYYDVENNTREKDILSVHLASENFYNDEVEIIEEEKKIPEKIIINDNGTIGFPNGEWTARNMDKAFAIKFNQLIDYLESKGE